MRTELRKIKMEQGKTCSRCHTWKPLSEYHKQGFNSNGHQRIRSECRDCKQDYERNHPRERFNDPYHTVYFLPHEDYIGMTNNFKERMSKHKSNGKNIDNVYEVIKTESVIHAHLIETLFHYIGFKGYHKGASKENTKTNPQVNFWDILKIRQQ